MTLKIYFLRMIIKRVFSHPLIKAKIKKINQNITMMIVPQNQKGKVTRRQIGRIARALSIRDIRNRRALN